MLPQVRLMEDELALQHVLPPVLRFLPAIIILPLLRTHLCTPDNVCDSPV
jgi:hypothetical protein